MSCFGSEPCPSPALEDGQRAAESSKQPLCLEREGATNKHYYGCCLEGVRFKERQRSDSVPPLGVAGDRVCTWSHVAGQASRAQCAGATRASGDG